MFLASRISGLTVTLVMGGWLTGQALAADGGWPQYAGEPGGDRYSSLTQINRDNVKELELAWSFRTGAQEEHPDLIDLSGEQLPFQLARHKLSHREFWCPT